MARGVRGILLGGTVGVRGSAVGVPGRMVRGLERVRGVSDGTVRGLETVRRVSDGMVRVFERVLRVPRRTVRGLVRG